MVKTKNNAPKKYLPNNMEPMIDATIAAPVIVRNTKLLKAHYVDLQLLLLSLRLFLKRKFQSRQ